MVHYTPQVFKAEMCPSFWTSVLLKFPFKVYAFVIIHVCPFALPLRLLYMLILRRVSEHQRLSFVKRLGD